MKPEAFVKGEHALHVGDGYGGVVKGGDGHAQVPAVRVARPQGLEPRTPRFEAWCSIQLSYGRVARIVPGELLATLRFGVNAVPDLPLAGITVLDLGQIYNGPYCGYLLAMSGARVIKVEPPGGEGMRGRGGGALKSYAFMMLNGNKETVTLNLKSARGRELLRGLAAKADVLLENFSPGTMDRHGVGSDALRAINPRLVYAAGTGFGSTGPHRDYLAMDITVQAMTGVVAITGNDGEPPLKAGPALCDILGGVHLYSAITTALFRRERTGEGATLDVAMQDAVFPTLTTALGAYYLRGGEPPRTGNHHQGMAVAPYNVYAARDGHVAIICIRERHWASLLTAMGREDLADDPRLWTCARGRGTWRPPTPWSRPGHRRCPRPRCSASASSTTSSAPRAVLGRRPPRSSSAGTRRARQARPRALRRGRPAEHGVALRGRRTAQREAAARRRGRQ